MVGAVSPWTIKNYFRNFYHDRFREEIERNPDDWYRRRNPALNAESLKAAAGVVGAKVENLVFVENVTTGDFIMVHL